mmetsp:Transcript_60049/g.130239  ORF Transcript_60049/g.130239 Transcript_60049/m.130239 type:complete len:270 (+) Transcript_60049:65-874(+)
MATFTVTTQLLLVLAAIAIVDGLLEVKPERPSVRKSLKMAKGSHLRLAHRRNLQKVVSSQSLEALQGTAKDLQFEPNTTADALKEDKPLYEPLSKLKTECRGPLDDFDPRAAVLGGKAPSQQGCIGFTCDTVHKVFTRAPHTETVVIQSWPICLPSGCADNDTLATLGEEILFKDDKMVFSNKTLLEELDLVEGGPSKYNGAMLTITVNCSASGGPVLAVGDIINADEAVMEELDEELHLKAGLLILMVGAILIGVALLIYLTLFGGLA